MTVLLLIDLSASSVLTARVRARASDEIARDSRTTVTLASFRKSSERRVKMNQRGCGSCGEVDLL
jgi:hypothetical protein